MASSAGSRYVFPYHEPSLVQLLVLGSFFVLLNLARLAGDALANVGILGELAVGLIYGAPLAGILEDAWQSAFTVVGYLGLVILVLEGGLETDLGLARRNLGLSTAVALTGLLAPILLSLLLLHLALHFTLLQAFTAGAALSSTSLGTTFSIISQAGLADTRLGAVLTSAAIIDDVVGLVLLQVVVSLGGSTGYSSTEGSDSRNANAAIGWAVGRPLLASLAMLLVSLALFKLVIAPIYRMLIRRLPNPIARRGGAYNLVMGVIVIFAYSAVASLSGTSILLGAFVAGLVLASLSKVLEEMKDESLTAIPTFASTYRKHIHQIQLYFLRPLFFASIGYGIPIRALFSGRTVWQGLVYTLICIFGKLLCGSFVLIEYYFNKLRRRKPQSRAATRPNAEARRQHEQNNTLVQPVSSKRGPARRRLSGASATHDVHPRPRDEGSEVSHTRHTETTGEGAEQTEPADRADDTGGEDVNGHATSTTSFPPAPHASKAQVRPSLWPVSLLLGAAMVARGEISLLIANVAQTDSPELMPNDLFYITIWAVLLCTLVGPVTVGLLVKRMQKNAKVLPLEWGAPPPSGRTS